MIMRVALRVNNLFYKLMAFGLGAAYAIQVFLTIGGAIKFIPLTGVNLPFISSGGSSLFASMIFIGIIQALYVISEADVEREREMIANGEDLTEFEGYQRFKKKVPENYELDTINIRRDKIIKVEVDDGRIQKVEPEEEKTIQWQFKKVTQKNQSITAPERAAGN